jgi:hypothetical protein
MYENFLPVRFILLITVEFWHMSSRLYSKKRAGKEPYFLFIVYFAFFWQGGQEGQ